MNKTRIDSRYSNLIQYIYTNAALQIRLKEDGGENDGGNSFWVERSVRQGDTISPKLHPSLFVLEDVFKNLSWEKRA